MNYAKIAELIYEATRLEAEWSKRPIIPEKWNNRDEAFRNQFVDIVRKYIQDGIPTPEEAHNSWMESYFKMGWKYGKERSVENKTHPDLIPFDELPKEERDKDAIFLCLVWFARELKDLS